MKTTSRAFTFIEILTCIAIVALIAGIFLCAMDKSKSGSPDNPHATVVFQSEESVTVVELDIAPPAIIDRLCNTYVPYEPTNMFTCIGGNVDYGPSFNAQLLSMEVTKTINADTMPYIDIHRSGNIVTSRPADSKGMFALNDLIEVLMVQNEMNQLQHENMETATAILMCPTSLNDATENYKTYNS